MKYNLSDRQEIEKAKEHLNGLIRLQVQVEVKRVPIHRTTSQNNYLHLILTAFGMHFGYDLYEAKLVYKEVNRELYYYKKKGRTFIRSSADLTKEEMMKSIDLFIQKSAENGCPLPIATDQDWLAAISNEAEREHYK